MIIFINYLTTKLFSGDPFNLDATFAAHLSKAILVKSRSEGFPLTLYFFLGTMGTGAWPDSRVVGGVVVDNFFLKL